MNKVKILIFVLIGMFVGLINVKASSMSCHYEYIFNNNQNLGINIDVKYDGTKVTVTKNTSSYQNVNVVDNLPSTIQTTYIKNSQGKLACPFFAVKTELKTAGRTITYNLDFKINENTSGYTKITAQNGGEIDDSTSGNTEQNDNNNILYTCVYNDKETNKNVFSFKINESGYGSNFTGLGTYGGYSVTRDTTEKFTQCPTYVNSTCDVTHKICNVKFNETSGNWIYVGAGNNADGVNSSLVATYYNIQNSSSKVQILVDSATGYRMVLNNGGTISNSNLSSVKSRIDNKDFPKYLIEKGGSYAFSDNKPETGTFDNLYASSTGVPAIKEEMYETCEQLFGQSFLKWLDDNVFMVIRIAVPILLILLTTIDFAKVVFTDDKEGMQHAFGKFVKRAIAAILIFLTPTIIVLIAQLIDPKGNDLGAVTKCVQSLENISENASN